MYESTTSAGVVQETNENGTVTAFPARAAEKAGEDTLLVEIDAFRGRVQQLSQLILQRKEEADALASELSIRQGEIRTLEAEIAERQKEADGLLGDVEHQVDRVLRSVESTMGDLNRRMEEQNQAGIEAAASQTRAVSEAVAGIQAGLADSVARLDSLLRASDASAAILGTLHSDLGASSAGITQSLGGLNEGLTQLQSTVTDVASQVHTESVQSYRNTQDLLKSMDHREEDAASAKERLEVLKRRLNALTFLGVVNLAGLAAVLVRLFFF